MVKESISQHTETSNKAFLNAPFHTGHFSNYSGNNSHDVESINVFRNKILKPFDSPVHTVVNLSERHLSTAEHTLLERGLNFCPTPGEPHMGDLRRDLDSFHSNLRIKSFFEPERQTKLVSSTSTPNLFTTTPADSVPSDVERAIAKSKVLKPCKKWAPPPTWSHPPRSFHSHK